MVEKNSEESTKVGLNIFKQICDTNPKVDQKSIKKILLSFTKIVEDEFIISDTKKRAKLFNLKLVSKSSGLLITARDDTPKEKKVEEED